MKLQDIPKLRQKLFKEYDFKASQESIYKYIDNQLSKQIGKNRQEKSARKFEIPLIEELVIGDPDYNYRRSELDLMKERLDFFQKRHVVVKYNILNRTGVIMAKGTFIPKRLTWHLQHPKNTFPELINKLINKKRYYLIKFGGGKISDIGYEKTNQVQLLKLLFKDPGCMITVDNLSKKQIENAIKEIQSKLAQTGCEKRIKIRTQKHGPSTLASISFL